MLGVLEQIAIILVLGIVLKAFADKARFPYIVLFILGGTILATYSVVDMQSLQGLPEVVRTLALIVIVFSSGFYLNLGQIIKQSRNILWLASFGVLLTALIVSAITMWLLPIPLIIAAFLGALLSGTDTGALSSAIDKKQTKVTTVLTSESMFNTPLTVILPLFILDYVAMPELVLLNVPKFFSLILVGGIVGFFGAYFGQSLLSRAKGQHEEIVGLMIAIITYVAAEAMFGSGILAVAICSVLLTSTKIPEKRWFGTFNRELAFLFTIFVFVFLGAELTFDRLVFTEAEVLAVIVAVILSRIVATQIVLYRSDLSIADRFRIGVVAPRGTSVAALAPLILYSPYIDQLSAEFVVKIVYLAIVVSILFSLVSFRLFVAGHEERPRRT